MRPGSVAFSSAVKPGQHRESACAAASPDFGYGRVPRTGAGPPGRSTNGPMTRGVEDAIWCCGISGPDPATLPAYPAISTSIPRCVKGLRVGYFGWMKESPPQMWTACWRRSPNWGWPREVTLPDWPYGC